MHTTFLSGFLSLGNRDKNLVSLNRIFRISFNISMCTVDWPVLPEVAFGLDVGWCNCANESVSTEMGPTRPLRTASLSVMVAFLGSTTPRKASVKSTITLPFLGSKPWSYVGGYFRRAKENPNGWRSTTRLFIGLILVVRQFFTFGWYV